MSSSTRGAAEAENAAEKGPPDILFVVGAIFAPCHGYIKAHPFNV